MGFRLEAWRRSARSRLVAHPRFYLFDTGVTNALTRRLTSEIDTASLGRLFEQWIVLECRRAIDYARSEAQCYFWRTNHGAEVDLVIEKHGRVRVAAEIKHRSRVSSAGLSGLRSFAEAEPKVPLVAVTTAPHAYKIGNVLVLPWTEFLDRLPDWL